MHPKVLGSPGFPSALLHLFGCGCPARRLVFSSCWLPHVGQHSVCGRLWLVSKSGVRLAPDSDTADAVLGFLCFLFEGPCHCNRSGDGQWCWSEFAQRSVQNMSHALRHLGPPNSPCFPASLTHSGLVAIGADPHMHWIASRMQQCQDPSLVSPIVLASCLNTTPYTRPVGSEREHLAAGSWVSRMDHRLMLCTYLARASQYEPVLQAVC